ncbi:hypothetical protein AV540_07525 [Brevibacillus parabrevis]|nr:hypothetical protein AV540_07525 [Brevibacillus parabrevis]HBZ81327.1 hypothetical protein [Brevibacillus sp.]
MKLLLIVDQAFLLYFTRTAIISQTKFPTFPQKCNKNMTINVRILQQTVGELILLFVHTNRFII